MKKSLLISLGILAAALLAHGGTGETKSRPRPDLENPIQREGGFYRGAGEKAICSKSLIHPGKDNRYTFSPVLQGDTLRHDFILRNTGDKPMTFKRVKSCCGMILIDHSRAIDPGGDGRFTVLIQTDKYGGRTISGRLEIDMADPAQPGVSVDAFVPVKKLAELSQFKIVLNGKAGQPVEGTTLILPEKDHPFTLTGIKARKGLHIDYSYGEVTEHGNKGYRVTVKNTMAKPGIYRDMLYVGTSDPARPEIRVRVEGRISP
jgi:hypothetical protein